MMHYLGYDIRLFNQVYWLPCCLTSSTSDEVRLKFKPNNKTSYLISSQLKLV